MTDKSIKTKEELRYAIILPEEELSTMIDKRVEQGINEALKQRTPQKSHPQETTDVKGAASYIGRQVSTVYSLVHKQKIPFHKPPGASKLIFYFSELDEWIKGSPKQSPKEMAQQKLNEFNDRRVK